MNRSRRAPLVLLAVISLAGLERTVTAQDRDPSLDAAGYRAEGFPDVSRTWSPADYPAVTPLLVRLGQRSPAPLPRYQSRRSGAVFTRMLDRAPLQALRTDGEALATRFEQANGILSSLSAWLAAYNNAPRAGGTWDDELVELFARLAEAADLMLALLDELRAQMTPAQRDAPQARDGYVQVQRGIAQICTGILGSFVPPDRRLFSTPSLERLAGYMIETMPRLLSRLPAEARTDVRTRIDAAITQNQGSAGLVAALTRLRDATATR